jgi:CDP-glycerol glycerophosphotransferase
LKKIYILLGSVGLNILGWFIKTDDKLVLFVANIGKNFSGSPYEIFKYMQQCEAYKEFNCVWAFNDPNKFEEYNLNMIRFDSLKYFITALKAKYWITDVNIERSLNFKKKNTIYLNTWHGVALKKIGNDDKNSGRYDYSNVDFLCVSSEYDKKVYTSALNANSNAFLECGMPRNDALFGIGEDDIIFAKETLGIPKDKKVILYAPTWRDSINNGKSFDFDVPLDFRKWEKVLGNEYVVLFRAHDRTTKLLHIEFNDFVRDFSHYEPLNDLLIASDILITDYSSIVFDYSILEKPFFCFGYDYEQYCSERGIYFDAEQVYPHGVFRDENSLLQTIINIEWETECRNTKKINDRFMAYSHGNATQQCVEALFKV